ncbi:hypothetical protein CONCODRAFT_83256 [Conidiobolus coronatus NRRL 28638]|uniref:Uncharacterized protein n=1 Tax=Conidiobolus coronatus (strain ATCC 28846 / CBS 209.66 / NRRL 28638) TaxID=796925 RepID=A0A137PFT1_CONC2|nr:hypothetical protein CONCODRAFT_83256 [Conidiobolus coronatus NRRL 28638]|eukprot:KXN73863.1 hypothetical protein CONCODRAFT_83256 [Conidiobolus coronatus NRRL 28638]
MKFFAAVILAANAAIVSAWCGLTSTPSHIIIYRQTELKGEHQKIKSGDTCVNIKGSWKSARAASINDCRIYDTADCKGNSIRVDITGYRNPGFDIKAIKCPCDSDY